MFVIKPVGKFGNLYRPSHTCQSNSNNKNSHTNLVCPRLMCFYVSTQFAWRSSRYQSRQCCRVPYSTAWPRRCRYHSISTMDGRTASPLVQTDYSGYSQRYRWRSRDRCIHTSRATPLWPTPNISENKNEENIDFETEFVVCLAFNCCRGSHFTWKWNIKSLKKNKKLNTNRYIYRQQ